MTCTKPNLGIQIYKLHQFKIAKNKKDKFTNKLPTLMLISQNDKAYKASNMTIFKHIEHY